MGEKSVTVTIANRTYPLTVEAQEESVVLDAAKNINDRIAKLGKSFSVKDKQDLLAMAALQFATQYLDAKSKVVDEKENIPSQLAAIESLLDSHLSKKVQ